MNNVYLIVDPNQNAPGGWAVYQQGGTESIGDAQAHVDWLIATARRMRDMFETYITTKSAEMKAEREAAET